MYYTFLAQGGRRGVIEPTVLALIKRRVQQRAAADAGLLEELRAEIRPLAPAVRRIAPRSTTAVSLVAADGGNNRLAFDPYLVQVVRVVDSYGKQLCFDVVSPTLPVEELSAEQFDPRTGEPATALGLLMRDLGVRTLWDLSPMIPRPETPPDQRSPSWVQVLRDLYEWAALYQYITQGTFVADTLVVRDGLLRAKIFRDTLFIRLRELLAQAMDRIWRESRRRVYLVGFAKSSQVLTRYRLAMAVEETLSRPYPCYVRIPREIEKKAYVWPEYAVAVQSEGTGEAPRFVAGSLYLAKFGNRPHDPIWPVDLFLGQEKDEAVIFGYLLADAQDGFPVPLYPRSLQRAHEAAQLTGFDMAVLQDVIVRAIRDTLPPDKAPLLDAFRLMTDRSRLRYG